MSSSYFLERDFLGSARNIIDANSNAPLFPSGSTSSYRGSYGRISPSPYGATATGYHSHQGYGASSTESHETKKILSDVRIRLFDRFQPRLPRCLCLVSRPNPFLTARRREEGCFHQGTIIDQVRTRLKL